MGHKVQRFSRQTTIPEHDSPYLAQMELERRVLAVLRIGGYLAISGWYVERDGDNLSIEVLAERYHDKI